MKIDIQKAYEYVEWCFLKEVLVAMELPNLMIDWLMECVSTLCYSISLDGCLERYFRGAKGLRQGDPISPYLFILLMEAFSHILGSYTQQEGFQFHKGCGDLGITHLIFADDLFVLSAATCILLRGL